MRRTIDGPPRYGARSLSTLYANGWIVTCDDAGTEHASGWLLTEGAVVSAVGTGLEPPADVRRLTAGAETVAWIVPEGERWPGPDLEGGLGFAVEGLLLRGTYDLLTALERFLADDCATLLAEYFSTVPQTISGALAAQSPLQLS